MKEQNIPGICNIDTRALTKIIREKGTILGRIVMGHPPSDILPLTSAIEDPNKRNLVAEVSFAGALDVRLSLSISFSFHKFDHREEMDYFLADSEDVQSKWIPSYMHG